MSYCLAVRGGRADDWLFPSRSRPCDHIGTRQYARLVEKWVAMIDLDPRAYGTHSLRRTKVALVYKKTGNLRACQLLLGHRKLESTVRYLGIEVDDAPGPLQARSTSESTTADISFRDQRRTSVPGCSCHEADLCGPSEQKVKRS